MVGKFPLTLLGIFPPLLFAEDNKKLPQTGWELLFRPRLELVDVKDNGKRSAAALTSRISGTLFGRFRNLNWKIQLTASVVLYDRFSPERKDYEFVAEEDQIRPTELSVFWRREKYGFKLGRFRIKLDDERLIGSVDWRQMPQTFDAFYGFVEPISNLKIGLYYLFGRQGVLNTLSTTTFDKGQPFNYSPVVFVRYSPLKGTVISLLYVDLRKNSSTYGGNLSVKLNRVSIKAGFYGQRNRVAKKNSYLWRLFLDFPIKDFNFGLGYERFSKGFITPLTTLHKFNGWSDVFLKYTATSSDYGLTDFQGKIYYRSPFGTLGFIYHLFGSTEKLPSSSKRFGDEIDLLYKVSFGKNLSFLVKGARYVPNRKGCEESYCKETNKFWIALTFSFGGSF